VGGVIVTASVLAAMLALLLAFAYFGYRSATVRTERVRRLAALRERPAVAADFTTPEGAILVLEDAFRRHDLEGAVAAKDFAIEAELELAAEGVPAPISASAVAERAASLEEKFRAVMTASWPDFSGIESYFLDRQSCGTSDGARLVVVTEVSRFAPGTRSAAGFSEQYILVAETAHGWRVLNPVADPGKPRG
jgi:hypothetical protein